MQLWGEKRYYSLDYYLKETYHEKLYKLSLNGGMTCPNRDGTLGHDGCIFCSSGGSGDFASNALLSIPEQLQDAKNMVAGKYYGHSYIAYFQAYTNTYASVDYLETLFSETMKDPEVKILSIATRPDCLSIDILNMLARLAKQKPIWIELGLQTAHNETAKFIRRGYELDVFEQALQNLRSIHIPVIVHTILGLPCETTEQMLDTIRYLNTKDIQGIKFQLLHILKNTDLATLYQERPFWIPTLEEYVKLLGTCIGVLRPDIVVHRLTGDGPKSLLIKPEWSKNKRLVLNTIAKHLKELDIWQGKSYTEE
ncbi:TIGR01212 family radical SAM protein [Lachnospiraceae bacterium OttesenSCG-928-E19]|nr:TIGR01212 family radical SAM protein [Lachnospiraceae bacterium OttesenSCG-928-E19]